MEPISKTCLFGRSSRKREAGQREHETAIAFLVKAISVTATLVILSGGVPEVAYRAGSMTT